jgi:hypothetical protein
VWVNDILNTSSGGAGVPSGVLETNTVTSLLNGTLSIKTTQNDGKNESSGTYFVQAKGIASSPDFFGVFSDKANPRVESFVVYPTQTLPPAGQARTYVRQGDLGEDLDEDGTNEGFRFEFSQIYVGTEPHTLAYSSTPKQLLHFKSTVRISVFVSSQNNAAQTRTVVTDEYLEPGVGVVRTEAVTNEADGSMSQEVTELRRATVGGNIIGSALVTPLTTELPDKIAQMVYLPSRQWFVGSIYDDTSPHRNSLVVIDANTGVVLGYSAPFNDYPSLMRAAANADTLYLATGWGSNAHTLHRMSLALVNQTLQVTETGTLSLPVPAGASPGGDAYYATDIAVSPVDPNVVVVAAYSTSGSFAATKRTFVLNDMSIASAFDSSADTWAFNARGDRLISGSRNTEPTNGPTASIYQFQNLQITLIKTISTLDLPGSGFAEGDVLYSGAYRWSFTDLTQTYEDVSGCIVLPKTGRRACNTADGLNIHTLQGMFPLYSLTGQVGADVAGPNGVVAFSKVYSNVWTVLRDPGLQ